MLNTAIVIDDSESDRYLARRALQKAHVSQRVLEFPNAPKALELLGDRSAFEKECGPWPPRAVVLVDINMPLMSGFELVEQMQEKVRTGEILETVLVVAMYSSSNASADIDRAMSYDIVVDYVTKPITTESATRVAARVLAFDDEKRRVAASGGEGRQPIT